MRTAYLRFLTGFARDFHVTEAFNNGDGEAKLSYIYATVKPQTRRWDIPSVKIKACVNVLAERTKVWPTVGGWVPMVLGSLSCLEKE